MRLLIAPDKFKGSLSALAAAQAIERGFRGVYPELVVDIAPIADGGEGFTESLGTALNAEWITTSAKDPLGRTVSARYSWVAAQNLAIIEMGEASGLWRLKPEEKDPLQATTEGTGMLLKDAISRGAKRILVGLGGSATNDGGIGVARALGYRFLNDAGDYLPLPSTLDLLAKIERPEGFVLPEIIAACDVQNPLTGDRGAARVYSPQKWADPHTVELLEHSMRHLAEVCVTSFGRDFRDKPGAGAAGGLGFGLLTFCDAKIRPGFDIVAETMGLDDRIANADLVITGEGRLDDQTLDGKGPAGIAQRARAAGKKCIAFGGSVTEVAESSGIFDAVIPITDRPTTLQDAMESAAGLLERAAKRAAKLLAM
jgi:glycerate 2-kinase